MKPIIVSACLLGVECNHRGSASSSPRVGELAREHRLIPVCPETVGGLPTPRPAAEIQSDGHVRTRDGIDVTAAFERGADQAVALAVATGAERAVLKSRSPSCGCHEIHDGTFGGALVSGEGVTAKALRAAGLEVCADEDL